MRWAMGVGLVLVLGCGTPAQEPEAEGAAPADAVEVAREGVASPPSGEVEPRVAAVQAASAEPDAEAAREEKSRARRFADLILAW